MKIDEKTFKAMPAELQSLFSKCPNPGSDEVVGLFPVTTSGKLEPHHRRSERRGVYGQYNGKEWEHSFGGDSGSAARFFYQAKCSKKDREGSTHPTMKPTALMRYLCRLVTPPGGVILDPFMGSGSTGKAAIMEGFRFIGSDMSEEYFEIAKSRTLAAVERIKCETAQTTLF